MLNQDQGGSLINLKSEEEKQKLKKQAILIAQKVNSGQPIYDFEKKILEKTGRSSLLQRAKVR